MTKLGTLGRHTAVVLLLSGAASTVGAQVPASRTPWGDPDLQGIWDYRSMTPLQRPEELGDTARVGREDVPELVRLLEQQYRDWQEGLLGADWSDHFDNGLAEGGRTSLITSPRNGRLPPLTQTGDQRRRERLARLGQPRGPEDRLLTERCLVYKSAPLGWSGDNNHVQILQTPGVVAIVHEMIHEAVIVPIGREGAGPEIRQWQGVARGWWEGDTLVVETRNRHLQWAAMNGLFPTPNMRVVERFTRVNAETLDYEILVDDPEIYVSTWTAAWPMRLTEGPMYEYACHEGNHSMELTLRGARALER